MTNAHWGTGPCAGHTLWGIGLLICLVSVFKNAFIYFADYQKALNLTSYEYAIILLACYCGNISSLFFGIFVNKLFSHKYHYIATVFSLISGILSLLFCFITIIYPLGSSISVLYGCIIAFLYKNSASICYTTVVGLANEYSLDSRKGENISYLQLSWSISTLLYIPVGYMIGYNWNLPFIIFGSILVIYTFIINFYFKFDSSLYNSIQDININISADIQSNISSITSSTNINDIYLVFNKQIILILISILCCGIASGSFLITTSSFWMEDIYGLTSYQLGWFTLSIFIAEMFGSIIMSQISDIYGIFVCSAIAFIIKIIASLIIFNCSLIIGNDIGGLWLAVILNFCLFLGWEIFFITQILAMIEFGPKNVSKNIILLSNFAIASIAKGIGTVLSAALWNTENGLTVLSLIWLICNILGAVSYTILYIIKDYKYIDDMSMNNEYTPILDKGNSSPVNHYQNTDLPVADHDIETQQVNNNNNNDGYDIYEKSTM